MTERAYCPKCPDRKICIHADAFRRLPKDQGGLALCPRLKNTISNFLDLLRSGEEINCDLIIGGVDMPTSFVWDEDCKITDYGIKKYKAIMEAEYTRLENGNIEIHCDDDRLGEKFCMAAAGYIGETEYEKIFGSDEED